jgi:lipoprotein signal peptidase
MKAVLKHWWRVLPFIITAALIIFLTVSFTKWEWVAIGTTSVAGGAIADYLFSRWLAYKSKKNPRRRRRRRVKSFFEA